MNEQIPSLLKVSLENIEKMMDVNMVVGNPIKYDDLTIIPVSKVKMGFLSGGSEYSTTKEELPFGGGAGGTVSITPVGFLVCKGNDIKLLHLDREAHLVEKIIDKIPNFITDAKSLFKDEAEKCEV